MPLRALSRMPRRLALAATLALTILAAPSRAGDITQIVSFGDSLSDVGNTYLAIGYPPAPYFQGRYSNGPIWLEYLAGRLGIAATTAQNLAGGTDNAWGGAETGNGDSLFMGTPNIGFQISAYLATNPAQRPPAHHGLGRRNDFLNAGQTNPMVPVANLAADITALANAGGKQFIVPNLPLLGDLPATNTLPQAQRDGLNFLTLAFNGLLSAELSQLQGSLGVTIHQLDVNGVFENILANPGAYGLTNVTNSAINDGVLSGQGYLFWDIVHPTTTVQELIGVTAYGMVPEPSSVTLLLAAGSVMLGWRLARSSGRSTRNLNAESIDRAS